MIERFIALRYLKSGKNSGFAYVVTWFSFVGIALGVATLIIVTSVMNGFRAELLEKIVGMKGHVVVTDTNHQGINNYPDFSDRIKQSDSRIENVIPQIEQQVVLISDGNARGVLVQGISQESLKSKHLISSNIVNGTMADFKKKDGVFIGKRLSELLGLYQGDSIKLMIPDGLDTPFGRLPKEEDFLISGIFEVGMNEYDKNIILMPLESAQDFFSMDGKVSQMEIFVNDVDNSTDIASKLSKTIGQDFMVLDWQHSDASIFHAVVVEKNVMTLILSIIVLVAVFNIISGLTMLTSSKVRDIAILRTMGIAKRSILKIFLLIGSWVGLLGTISGVVLGLSVSLNIDRIKRFLEKLSDSELFSEEIYFLSQIPSKTDWVEVCWISIFAISLCFVATLYPARKASKLDPAEALRM